MTTIRRSLLISLSLKYAHALMSLLTTAVLARLLTPSEMGVFLVAYTFFLIVDTVRDFGASNYLIQRREISLNGVRAAFTVTLIMSIMLSAGMVAFSADVAGFYQEDGLQKVLYVIAGSFLVLPFGATALALLKRDLAFDAIARITLAALAAYSLAVVGLAALGFSYMSLAWASLINVVISSAGAVLYRREFRIFRPSFEEWRQVVSFGSISCSTALINSLMASVPQLILGRILGFGAVGLYNRATLLCQMFDKVIIDGLYPVALPAFALKARGSEDLKAPYLRALEYITAVHWPFLLCLALLADPIVELLLGPQWLDVAPLARIVALASICLSGAFLTYPLMVALGRIQDTLIMSLIIVPVSLAVMFAASFHGLTALASSLLFVLPFHAYVSFVFIRRQLRFTWVELAAATRKSAVAALCAAGAPAIAVMLAGFRFDLSILDLTIAGAGAIVGWLIGLSVTMHPLLGEISGAGLVWRQMLRRLTRRQRLS